MMSGSQVFVFGSFSEDEACLFQKASVEKGVKSVKQNVLQFGSLDNRDEGPSRSSEFLSRPASSGQTTNRDNQRGLNVKCDGPFDDKCSILNGGRTNESASKMLRQVSKDSQDGTGALNSVNNQVSVIKSELLHFPDLKKATHVNNTDNTSVKLHSTGKGESIENGLKETMDKTKCVLEAKEETNSNLEGNNLNNLQQLESLSLENINASDKVEEDSSSVPAKLSNSWAARFGSNAGNDQATYSICGDKGRLKSGSASVTARASQSKVNSSSLASLTGNEKTSRSCGEVQTAVKRLQPRGLVNSGNLCFLNATLQALLSCSPFFQLLQTLRSRDIPEAGYPTLRAFVKFVAEFEDDGPADAIPKRNEKAFGGLEAGRPFCPTMFDSVLKSFSPDQPLSASGRPRQEDAQEFLSFVMDRMHDELLKLEGTDLTSSGGNNLLLVTVSEDDDWETVGPKNRTAVTRTQSFMESELSGIFGGQMRSVVKSRGNKASATVQPFLLLHLDILPEAVNTVEDALHLFASPESLEGYRISAGKAGVVSASKSVKLQTLSKVLILHLMRFSYGSAGSSKLHKPVRFHPEIVLGRELLVSPMMEGRRYELVATVSHHGRDPSKGHYTADTKHSDGHWLRFDDAAVSVVGLNKVLHDQAYILFYRQI